MLDEAADAARKLAPDENGRNGLALGLAAARLAPYDWPKAEAMLATLTSPGDTNRYLAAAVPRIARVDFDKARSLLGRFKPGNDFSHTSARLRLAFVVAAEKPDLALELVGEITERPLRSRGTPTWRRSSPAPTRPVLRRRSTPRSR